MADSGVLFTAALVKLDMLVAGVCIQSRNYTFFYQLVHTHVHAWM